MTPRRLRLLPAAELDLERRTHLLRAERGGEFAEAYVRSLVGRLARIAYSGAVVGTRAEARPSYRTFGHHGQATIIVRFTDQEMLIARIYFRGQDWSRSS